MDKLSIFATNEIILTSKGGKTLDSLTDGLDALAVTEEGILDQLKATHLGLEDDWGKEFSVEDVEFEETEG